MRHALIALALALIAPAALADVVSPGPNAVAVTLYRDKPASARSLRESGDDDDTRGLVMISETRIVDLPAGRTRIAFQGIADRVIPASATLQGLPGRQVERDFDYDLLDPASLIEKSVGGQVTIRRLDARTGKLEDEPATLVSGSDGVVATTAAGVEALGCGAGPEAIVFDHLPPGLAAKPTLSALVETPAAGRYQLTLSYLAVGVDWSADYVARIAPDGRSLDLTGWLTLSNRSQTSFADAPTSVVAGTLARVPPDLPDIEPAQRSDACWPMGTTSDSLRVEAIPVGVMGFATAAPAPPVSELVVVAEKRRATLSSLGDYKLYTLAEPTTLAANETKQIRFLHLPAVAFEKAYVVTVDDMTYDGQPAAAHIVLSLDNTEAKGLGQALPAGAVSFRQPQAAASGLDLYLGEAGLRDTPVGVPFELTLGEAPGVTASKHVTSDQGFTDGRVRLGLAFTLTNANALPVTIELRQRAAGRRIVAESAPHLLKNAADTWRLTLPAHGAATLSYTYETE